MRDATYIGRDDGSRFDCMQGIELAIAQSLGQLGLRDRIGTGRTTAQVRIGKRLQIEPQLWKQVLTDTTQVLPVLKGADRQSVVTRQRVSVGVDRGDSRTQKKQKIVTT